jgi:hypothetical protein
MSINMPKYIAIGLLGCIALCSTFTGCKPEQEETKSTCVESDLTTVDCTFTVVTMDAANKSYKTSADLVPYVCGAGDRPDSDPSYVTGYPEGRVCADVGPIGEDGSRGYCCGPTVGSCGLNPTVECPQPKACADKPEDTCNERYYAFQCVGGTRPDFLNSDLYCRNGVVAENGFVDYCCRDINLPIPSPAWGTACTEVTGSTTNKTAEGTPLVCDPSGLTAFTCPMDDLTALPTTDTLAASKSRADFYAPMCTKVGVTSAKQDFYCCYTPKLPPPGGTCQGDMTVPGCAGPRFGFSCYGPDRPDEDYIPFDCSEAGVKGTNQYGYEATLYCCDFKPEKGLSI